MDPVVLALVVALVGNAVSILVVVLSNVSASRREQGQEDQVRQAREHAWRVTGLQHD